MKIIIKCSTIELLDLLQAQCGGGLNEAQQAPEPQAPAGGLNETIILNALREWGEPLSARQLGDLLELPFSTTAPGEPKPRARLSKLLHQLLAAGQVAVMPSSRKRNHLYKLAEGDGGAVGP